MNLKEKIEDWYRGKYIPPPPDDPNSPIFFGIGSYQQPLLARIIGAVARFWVEHWQWIIGTILAVVALVVSIK
jgi:hypothetical protein